METKTESVVDFYESHAVGGCDSITDNSDWGEDIEFVKRVIAGEATDSDIEHFDEELGDLHHKRDGRDATEYGEELIRSWLLEDLIVRHLESLGLDVQLNGEDSERVFLSRTSSAPDIEVNHGDTQTYIEVMADFTGFWQEHPDNPVDLRDEKYQALREHENSLLLGIDFANQQVFLMDIHETQGIRTQSHPAWRKRAYRLPLHDTEFFEFDELNERLSDHLD